MKAKCADDALMKIIYCEAKNVNSRYSLLYVSIRARFENLHVNIGVLELVSPEEILVPLRGENIFGPRH